jgi:3-hydroxyacyl-CoA dehydrogenase/enoyl-CoA hydratase/3-hydroxybutyryl-CoA epimerase
VSAFQLEIRDGIAWAVLDLPGEPINKITNAVRDEMERLLDSLAIDDNVQAVILKSGKGDSFIAGADIEEFARLASKEEAYGLVREGQALINRLGMLGKPAVAAIQGACLGGGLEAALACAYRVVSEHPKTRLGLPEVQLGILPAAGGCQRLPRLIGLRRALDLILAGKQVPATRAFKLGMADELVHPAILDDMAEAAARRLIAGWRPDRGGISVAGLLLERNPLGRKVVFRQARKEVIKKTGGHYPAPLAAVTAIEHGLANGVKAGLQMEAKLFAELAVSDVSRKLVQIFFATTALKKDPGVPPPAAEPKPVRNLGIVGAGFMGAGIGSVAARAGVDVRFRDQDLESVARGLAAARRILQNQCARHRIDRHEYQRLVQLLSGDVTWAGFKRADLVIEAVFESLEVKHDVFRQLEREVRDDCILASNTSTIPIARIAEATHRHERVLGMHFFSPVEKMPLLEVIVTDRTAPWATVTAVTFGRALGKTVIVVRDHPGFWVNRILAPYVNEAGRLLEEGVAIESIDRAMTNFGFPVGPIALLDQVGLDVAQKASGVLHEAFGDRMRPMEGLVRLTADGRLGRKNGRGFYRYENGKKAGVDETVYEIIGARPSSNLGREDISRRLVYAMLNEAVYAFDDGVVRSPRDGDIGAVFGIGFPPFRGGPLRYLDDLMASRTVETLRSLTERFGERFTPARRLVEMADRGERFYPEIR